MSVNMPATRLRTKVGRPCRLSDEAHQQFFPQMMKEDGFEYYMVKKPLAAGEEGAEEHCLRTPYGASPNTVNKMAWFCPSCISFVCTWRERVKHQKRCVDSQQSLLNDLMAGFQGMGLTTSELDAAFASNIPESLDVGPLPPVATAVPVDPFTAALEATLEDMDDSSAFGKPHSAL
mmetsp:Transcript_1997/g.7225  ORF Transcript_1997/g.7225 Transcript_1997/m.7225 type:complete len:176 (-) Transcript_1997:103-630(-)